MDEYVEKCRSCEGTGNISFITGATAQCCFCNGTGQQLIKPIPEGAVILTGEQFALMAQGCPPAPITCRDADFDCVPCWEAWVKAHG